MSVVENIRGYTEDRGRIYFDQLTEVEQVKRGFCTHHKIVHQLLAWLFGEHKKSVAVTIMSNKVIYINIKSFNAWKERQAASLSQLDLNQATIQAQIDILRTRFCPAANKGYGYDAVANQIYRLKPNPKNSDSLEEVSYKLGRQLGSGAYGKVYYLQPSDSSKKGKAVKIAQASWYTALMLKNDLYSPDPSTILQEDYKFLDKFKMVEGVMLHPKKFINQSATQPAKLITACYDGSLDQVAYKLTLSDKIEVCRQLIHGLTAIHAENLVHTDIKMDNILYKYSSGNRIRYDLTDPGPGNHLVSAHGYTELFKKEDIKSLGIVLKFTLLNHGARLTLNLLQLKRTYDISHAPLSAEQTKAHGLRLGLVTLVNQMADGRYYTSMQRVNEELLKAL